MRFRRARNAEPAVLVGGALIAGGGLITDEGRPGIEGERLEARIDDGTVLGRATHHRRPHEEAQLEGLGRLAVAVAITPIVDVHEEIRTALQFGVDPARRPELEATGARFGDSRAGDAVSLQHVAGAPRPCRQPAPSPGATRPGRAGAGLKWPLHRTCVELDRRRATMRFVAAGDESQTWVTISTVSLCRSRRCPPHAQRDDSRRVAKTTTLKTGRFSLLTVRLTNPS
jgi:hypothetical protein